MPTTTQKDKAIQFHSLHTRSEILVLPNAWDAASARIFEQAGFAAVATTSSGVAAALGYVDGEQISRDLLVEATKRIASVVTCPVTADIEAGYGDTIEEVLQTVKVIIEAGAVGINIEDSKQRMLMNIPRHVELLRAIRQLAESMDMPFVINARTDVFLLGRGNPADYIEEAVRRANAYREAGADCLFPIGLSDTNVIAKLVQAISGPVNILAVSNSPSITELAQLGVARVSFGSGPMRATLGYLRQIAHELLEQGTYTTMNEKAISGAELGRLFEE